MKTLLQLQIEKNLDVGAAPGQKEIIPTKTGKIGTDASKGKTRTGTKLHRQSTKEKGEKKSTRKGLLRM